MPAPQNAVGQSDEGQDRNPGRQIQHTVKALEECPFRHHNMLLKTYQFLDKGDDVVGLSDSSWQITMS